MALAYFEVMDFPTPRVEGLPGNFRVTAKDATGATITTYVGTVMFNSTDALAELPPAYTFTLGDSGTHVFPATLSTPGFHYLTASDNGAGKSGRQLVAIIMRPLGYGKDPYGVSAMGASAISSGVHLTAAVAVSTREIAVTSSDLLQSISKYLAGDALNPATWSVQRFDTNDFFTIVSVLRTNTYEHTLTVLEPLGPFAVEHRVSSTTALDGAGNLIRNPRQADFFGVTEYAKSSNAAVLAARKVSTRDYANVQLPTPETWGGTLVVSANGDYETVTGAELVRKLIFRRLMSTPGDFFHLPDYGVGLRVKEPVPTSDLVKLKASVEKQVIREPEVNTAQASITLNPAEGILTVNVRAMLQKSGESLEIGLPISTSGVVL